MMHVATMYADVAVSSVSDTPSNIRTEVVHRESRIVVNIVAGGVGLC